MLEEKIGHLSGLENLLEFGDTGSIRLLKLDLQGSRAERKVQGQRPNGNKTFRLQKLKLDPEDLWIMECSKRLVVLGTRA